MVKIKDKFEKIEEALKSIKDVERKDYTNVITDIEPQKKNKDRFNIYVDGRFFIGVAANTVTELNLYKDKKINKEDLEDLVKNTEYNNALNDCFYYLGFQLRSEVEIRKRLEDKEFDKNIIEDVVARLKTLGYIDDKEFARAFVRTKLKTRRYGKKRVSYDLKNKGVEDRTVLDEEYTDEEEIDICKEVINKYSYKYKDKYKMKNFLYRRGFTTNSINSAINYFEKYK